MRVFPQKETNMNGEKIGNTSEQPNEAYDVWANISGENDSTSDKKNWKEAVKTPEGEARYQENLHSIDKRTEQYVWKLTGNLDALLGEFVAEGEDKELCETVTDKLNENIYDGGLNGAYLNKEGFLYTGNLANEYRGYDEEGNDKKALEDLDTAKPEGAQTGDAYKDNMSTMDERTRAYIWRLGSNLHKLLGDKGIDGDISQRFIDKMNQAITDGKLNGAYLSDDGRLHIRETGDEYRGYDMEKSSKIETSTTKEPEVETKQPTTKPGEKTPEELGFRDW